MTTTTTYCPTCGSPVAPIATFCSNCGAKVGGANAFQPNPAPSYLPASVQRPAVSTGPYKAIIAVLLIIIILLGVGYFEASAGHFPFSGNYRYMLAHAPNFQSTQPPPAYTTGSYQYPIWNACNGPPSLGCSMTPNGWREGSVPDTFDYYVAFTSNVSVTVYFFTMGQFVQFSVCNGDVSCVSGSYDQIQPTTNLPPYTLFKLGEGCADYLAIYVASGPGVMHPDVGVSRPAVPPSNPTGYCAQTGA